jgi:hypothetical protein
LAWLHDLFPSASNEDWMRCRESTLWECAALARPFARETVYPIVTASCPANKRAHALRMHPDLNAVDLNQIVRACGK